MSEDKPRDQSEGDVDFAHREEEMADMMLLSEEQVSIASVGLTWGARIVGIDKEMWAHVGREVPAIGRVNDLTDPIAVAEWAASLDDEVVYARYVDDMADAVKLCNTYICSYLKEHQVPYLAYWAPVSLIGGGFRFWCVGSASAIRRDFGDDFLSGAQGGWVGPASSD